MGLRPIRPGIAAKPGVERAAAAGVGAETSTETAPAAPVAARWGAGDALPATVVSRSAIGAGGGLAALQLSPLAAHAPAAPGPGMAVTAGLPNEIVFPPRDAGIESLPLTADPGPRVITSGSWANVTPSAPASAPASIAAGGPVSGARGHRPGRPLTLARSAAGGPAPAAPQDGGGPVAPVIARIIADPSTPSAPPTVQASASGGTGGMPVAAITATPIVQRADGAAPPPPSSSEGHSDTELDDLARALFGRIRTHLRAEVIHEREAKGLTFDAF